MLESSVAYRRYLLTVLILLLACNMMDRFALGVVLQDIKADLGLSDTELGLMSGIAFALFYSVMGIPIARWADRGDRVLIISLTAALWSVAVASCGAARTFAQLLLVRVGVAVGEAGGFVPAFSLLSDYFNRDERPRALGIYQLGAPLSVIFGYFLSGWLNDLFGWRVMFVALATPGVVLAVLAKFTLKEPRYSNSSPVKRVKDQPSLYEVFKTLSSNATFRSLLMSSSLIFFFMYGILQWQPTFFVRSFALSSREVGAWLAGVYGFSSLIGTYYGGVWASRYAARNETLQLRAISISMAGSAVLSTLTYLSSNLYLTLTLSGGLMFLQTVVNGPLYAMIQSLAPERARAMATAVVLLFSNLIGMGLGPLATGLLSDALHGFVGEESLRDALLILSPGLLWAGWHAWRASNTVARDLQVFDELRLANNHVVVESVVVREH